MTVHMRKALCGRKINFFPPESAAGPTEWNISEMLSCIETHAPYLLHVCGIRRRVLWYYGGDRLRELLLWASRQALLLEQYILRCLEHVHLVDFNVVKLSKCSANSVRACSIVRSSREKSDTSEQPRPTQSSSRAKGKKAHVATVARTAPSVSDLSARHVRRCEAQILFYSSCNTRILEYSVKCSRIFSD